VDTFETGRETIQMNDGFPVGKLKAEHLIRLLDKYRGAPDPAVIVGPRIGEDAAVIEAGEDLLIAKTDPITFAVDQIGRYAININANDIACMGGRPRWFLATILLPEDMTDEDLVDNIFSQLSEACKALGIAICGGHTEVTYGLKRPIVVGQMLGTVSRQRLVTSSGVRAGDHIIVTKGVAVEATALLAREKEDALSGAFDREFIERCKGFIDFPGISVLRDAEIATSAGGVHAMHDPTEGGLATGLHELAAASGVGLEIFKDAIPVYPETRLLCDFFGLDPLGVIASGALLIAADPASTELIIGSLRAEGIDCARVGTARDRSEGLTLVSGTEKVPLPCFEQDEISRVFS